VNHYRICAENILVERTVHAFLQSIGDTLLGLLFPDRCAGCGRSGSLFCTACQASLQPYPIADSTHITAARVTGQPPLLDEIAIAFVFEGTLREAIHRLKYKRVQRMASPLAELLVGQLRRVAFPADALIAVPLHPRRMSERGFNQSAVLAHHLSRLSGLPVLQSGLIRNRDTAHQVGLDTHARRQNVHNAFAWQDETPPPERVLLIDDVVTTGATLEACAGALRLAGTREVRALVLARSQ
jgi:ComF family protein